MQKKVLLFIAIVIAVVAVFSVVLFQGKDKEKDSLLGTEKNVVLSHVTSDVNLEDGGEFVYNVEQYVPKKSILVENLEKKGYQITTEQYEYSNGITGEQITAKKDKQFCIIVYGLDISQAEQVFSIFEKEYQVEEFYVLAQNEKYVYCISDSEIYEDAGFTGLENNGIQYVNHDNY